MAFELVAQPLAAFERWLAHQRTPAEAPSDPQAGMGREVFKRHCANCHHVREADSSSWPQGIGPDLTHLASRRLLAAATVPNTQGHLTGWVADPQGPKPGAHMPPTSMSPQELHAVVAYLHTLK
jgi:cytochrome c oxidase subunit 2